MYENYGLNESSQIHSLSPFSTNHITSCLGSRVDMVSNLGQSQWKFYLSFIHIK